MVFNRILLWVLGASLAAVVSGCGGASQTVTEKSSGQAFRDWVSGLDLAAVDSTENGGLPSIPVESGTAVKGGSTAGDQVVKLGADYLQAYNATVDGTALTLDAPLEGGSEGLPLAYGLYKVEGLAGLSPASLNVECLPRTTEERYYVGIADYTSLRWAWFGPFNTPEAAISLSERNHRFVSNLGNLYFLVACHNGSGATHSQTTLLFNPAGEGRLPGAPSRLVASDGVFEAAVGLAWLPGAGAQSYEIFRRQDGPGHEFSKLGDSTAAEYNDTAVTPGTVYIYKVRAVNAGGFSCFSNPDPGYAGAIAPPVGAFRIDGNVLLQGGEPAATIEVTLLGLPEITTVTVNAEGGFAFENLPAGRYAVVPHKLSHWCDPIYSIVELSPNHPGVNLSFTALNGELPTARIWGFSYAINAPERPGFSPIPEAAVGVKNLGTLEASVVQSNADGYFQAMELPVATFRVKAEKAGFVFFPETRDITVNHEVVTPPVFFRGQQTCPPPPQGECVIEGGVFNGDAQPLPGIVVKLIPSPEPGGCTITTNELGRFRFPNLPHGKYIVFPCNPQLGFNPQYISVNLLEAGSINLEFHSVAPEAKNRLWGFVFNTEGVAPESFVPMAGTAVQIRLDGTETAVTVQTNADGFFSSEPLDAGTYIVNTLAEGWSFAPPQFAAPVTLEAIPPPLVFRGYHPE